MKLVTFQDQWKKGWEEIKIYKKAFYHSDKLARIIQLKLQNRYVKCLWITLCLMRGESRGKTKQYRAFCPTLIKILFSKNIVNQVTTNISFTEKPGN